MEDDDGNTNKVTVTFPGTENVYSPDLVKTQLIPALKNALESVATTSINVAYHDGPTEIGFCRKLWQRGVAQTVTAEEWTAMQARADFNEFNFKEE